MKRRYFGSKKMMVLLVALLALFLVACGPALPDQSGTSSDGEAGALPDTASQDGDTLIIAMSNAPASQNPFYAQSTSAEWTMRFFYDTLLNQMSPTEFQPRLGEFSTEDNQTFTVKIHPEANWTDGQPVTADDVAFTLNTIAHPDTLTTHGAKIVMLEGTDDSGKLEEGLEELPGVEVVDEKTLLLKTKVPVDLNYISDLVGSNVLIAPKHVFEGIPQADLHTSEPATNPSVFSGAYEFVKYEEENYLQMQANEDYYLGSPKIQNVFVRVMDNAAMITALQAGDIHMVSQGGFGDIPHNDISLVQDMDHIQVEEYASPNVQYLTFNTEDERFSDPRVRQAVAHAIDRDLAVENLLLGHGETLAAPYSSANTFYHDPSLDPYPYDPEKARSLLEEAGFDFSQPVVLMTPTGNTVREQMADLIEQQLEAVGMTVDQERADFTTHMSRMRDGGFELAMLGQAHSYEPDLTNFLSPGGGSNYANYGSEEMDRLLQEGRSLVDAEDRKVVYDQVQALFKEDIPYLPTYSESVYSVQVKNLEGGVEEFYPATLADVQDWEFVSE